MTTIQFVFVLLANATGALIGFCLGEFVWNLFHREWRKPRR